MPAPVARRAARIVIWTLVLAAVPLAAAAELPSLVRTITSDNSGSSTAFLPFDGTIIALADFRGDGHISAVLQNDNGNVYVLDPSTGQVLATLTPGNAGCTKACYDFEGLAGPINSPVATDMDGSGRLSIVTANTAAVVTRWTFDPSHSSSTQFVFQKEWERRFNDYQSFTTMDATPLIADLLGDGNKEVVVSTEEIGVFAVRPDGTTLWKAAISGGHSTPTSGDLNKDGHVDIVVANDDGIIYALDGRTGAQLWNADTKRYVVPASIAAPPLVADIDGDGSLNVAVVARDAHDATNFQNDHIVILDYDNAGHTLWHRQPTWAAPLSHTKLVPVMVGSTHALLGGDWNTMGHKPGNFERVGPGHVFLISAAGKEIWHRDLNVAESDDDFAVAKINSDHQQVLAGCTSGGNPGLCVFDLASGAAKGFISTAPWVPTRGPAVGNLFGDGRLAFLVPVNQGTTGAVMVYHGTNALSSAFPGWGALNVPHGDSGADAPPPATLHVTFTPSGNNWWVQTLTDSDRPLATVSAAVNGGAWTVLDAYSWGWAKSFFVANGSSVTFRADATDGTTATSAGYLWPPGSAPPPSTTPPPSGFTATFQPCCGNEWWVQVGVTANEPLAGVDANVDGGPWTPLDHFSWGWAKSVHAPAGSQVTFRATSIGGSTSTSSAYTWPQP